MIYAIDPGNTQSAWVAIDQNFKPIDFTIEPNECLLKRLRTLKKESGDMTVIEMVASYGMAVGAAVFDTCVWIGRFAEAWEHNSDKNIDYVYRKDVKLNLCGQTRAKDTNIRQALIDRFGVVGTKATPGWFYGFKKDIWAAYAVGVTWIDMH